MSPDMEVLAEVMLAADRANRFDSWKSEVSVMLDALPALLREDSDAGRALRHRLGLSWLRMPDDPRNARAIAGTEGAVRVSAASDLVALSQWIDAGNDHRDPEAITWGRLSKIGEEFGEVIAAYIGMTGQNPRKGVTHSRADVLNELLDVAITALGAYEHLTDHGGAALAELRCKIGAVADRAGVR